MVRIFKKKVKMDFGGVNRAKKVTVRKNQGIKSGDGYGKKVDICKKWMTHEHESDNQSIRLVGIRHVWQCIMIFPSSSRDHLANIVLND